MAGETSGKNLWTPEQDNRLLDLVTYKTFGKIIADGHFPGCTTSSLIGRFHRLVKKGRAELKRHRKKERKTPVITPRAAVTLTKMDGSVLPAARPAAPIARACGQKTIFDLTHDDCRYPLPAPPGSLVSSVFCAREVVPGTSWCPHHSRLVWSRYHAERVS